MSWHCLQEPGGGILGGKLLGWRTVGAVEIEKYPRECLLARQRDGVLDAFPIWDDVCTFDGKPWKGCVDVVSGGFPCQDISAAGKGAGIDGVRSGLWKEMFRIICEVRPKYAFMENSPMLTSRGLGVVLGDLAEAGYDAEWMVLGAADVGAPHKRDRIWILARDREQRDVYSGGTEAPYADAYRLQCAEQGKQHEGSEELAGGGKNGVESGREVVDAASVGFDEGGHVTFDVGGALQKTPERELGGAGCAQSAIPDSDVSGGRRWSACEREVNKNGAKRCKKNAWWSAEPNVGRVADGVAARVDRLKAIGNGQVPLVAATAFVYLLRRFDHEIN